MKFKDKDGTVFEDIEEARDAYCKKQICGLNGACGLYLRPDCTCDTWCSKNPTEAARLMGYEVVEDDATEKGLYRKYIVKKADTGEEVTDCFILRPTKDHAAVAALREYARVTDNKALADDIWQWVGEKEANMDKQKPRICEVLEVEVGERFRVESDSCCLYPEAFIDGVGVVRASIGQEMNGVRICQLISGELRIIRKLRFTEEEVADARVLLSMFRQKWDRIERQLENGLVLCYNDVWMIPLNDELFPSIRPGQSVKLSEIVRDVE